MWYSITYVNEIKPSPQAPITIIGLYNICDILRLKGIYDKLMSCWLFGKKKEFPLNRYRVRQKTTEVVKSDLIVFSKTHSPSYCCCRTFNIPITRMPWVIKIYFWISL